MNAMDANFWLQKWQRGEIGFHESVVNPLLVAHVDKLRVPQGGRWLLPLCGKTLDIGWLLARGYRVVGVELSQLAVEALFAELGMAPQITALGALRHYQASNIDIFNGDIFALTPAQLGPVSAVYDRAALVALPAALRQRYAAQVRTLSNTAPQLLVTYEYDQSLRAGPPFSVNAEEVARLYADAYVLDVVAHQETSAAPNGRPAAVEVARYLKPIEG
ncbi:MAG: thiopurine S-methyltransferase [Pseudomonadales bacterium]|jgi:thiopurine S-methyltransferase|nr:thiopurine S-methyltransferase [Pseudomonadales bacterium]